MQNELKRVNSTRCYVEEKKLEFGQMGYRRIRFIESSAHTIKL